MFRKFLLLPLILLCTGASHPDLYSLSQVDRIRLAEAFRLADVVGNRIWKDWDKAPFAVLLVTAEYEYLIRHPAPSRQFQLVGEDPLLGSRIYFRARTQPVHFQATFPLDGTPTIVIGQAENTASKSSTPWVVTLLHEHFHQLQYTQPDYFQHVNALGLSRGDQTGMWMLEYPFPYGEEKVHEQFGLLTKLLHENLEAQGAVLSEKMELYLRERENFRKMLSEDDFKYFSFQLWQEGISRYTESRVAHLAATAYTPSESFRALKDYTSFGDAASKIDAGIMNELQTLDLKQDKRILFYPYGAAEGLLLDKINPHWQDKYFQDKFFLEKYFRAES